MHRDSKFLILCYSSISPGPQIEKIMTLIGAGIDFSRDQEYATPGNMLPPFYVSDDDDDDDVSRAPIRPIASHRSGRTSSTHTSLVERGVSFWVKQGYCRGVKLAKHHKHTDETLITRAA